MKTLLVSILSFLIFFTGCSTKNMTTTVKTKDNEGLINEEGKVTVKPVYKRVYNLDTINTNDYTHPHYINFHWIESSENRYAIVKNIDNKYGVIDENGNLILKVIYDSISNFFNGYAKVKVNNRYGLVNENFEMVIKPIYYNIRNVIDDSIIVSNYDKNNLIKYGCITTDNFDLVLPLDYDMIYLSNENRMKTTKDNKWGFIDTQCNLVADNIYNFADDYQYEHARVQRTDKLWTFLDFDGKEIERKTFNYAENFK